MKQDDKTYRLLDTYTRLQNGDVINKRETAQHLGVTERSIQRDIEDIREFLNDRMVENGVKNDVVYDHHKRGYYMEKSESAKLSNEEILAICKILLDSRAFTKEEMTAMLDKLLMCCVPAENRRLVEDLIANERFHYIEPRHQKVFIDKMWEIGMAIRESRYIEITYGRTKDSQVVKRKIQPQAIMFSEFYFYLAANIQNIDREKEFQNANDIYPTIYRIDRIRELRVLDEHFRIPYKDRFEEGEYRKRIQFMYGGRLRKIRFWYKGMSVEAVLDRLPTARIIEEKDGKTLIEAEIFGDGINMWLRSQGDFVEIVKE